jgi:hypothetical protein
MVIGRAARPDGKYVIGMTQFSFRMNAALG